MFSSSCYRDFLTTSSYKSGDPLGFVLRGNLFIPTLARRKNGHQNILQIFTAIGHKSISKFEIITCGAYVSLIFYNLEINSIGKVTSAAMNWKALLAMLRLFNFVFPFLLKLF